ncbi:ABC transporter permease [Microbacterium sp.]|uniref:ABC transporter permease n=1 Tax=Microbacterium sp. TaxID=51671 RepID=UPI0039E6B91F
MRTLDLVGTAIGNTFRSKTRTLLTVLAIFVGAFTLTLTNGLGTGINNYIDDTLSSIGASDVMTVTKQAETTTADGPQEYDPDAVTTAPGPDSGGAGGGAGGTVAIITADDLDDLAAVSGILRVEPVRSLSVDYIQRGDGTRFVIGAGTIVAGQTLQLAAGDEPDDAAATAELAIPVDYVDALGFDDDAAALGERVTIAVSDATGRQHTISATITGVAEETFAVVGQAGSLIPNEFLTDEIFGLQQEGLQDEQRDRYLQARVWFDAAQIDALQDDLDAAGFSSTTVEQQLGAFTTVIDGIVLVLNAFAVIALLAAAFGIVNTLLMSVQERTREIGLMKAMGMGSGRVFTLFSLEAAFIGFLGSAIGAGIAILAGTGISSALSEGLLADLPGLQLIAFDPMAIASTVILIMLVAFLAGTLPALRAARQDPVESLRYE